jgi:hypothetical protein
MCLIHLKQGVNFSLSRGKIVPKHDKGCFIYIGCVKAIDVVIILPLIFVRHFLMIHIGQTANMFINKSGAMNKQVGF